MIFLLLQDVNHGCITVFGDKYCLYKLGSDRSWSKAREKCQKVGGDLPMAETSEHMTYIASLYPPGVYFLFFLTLSSRIS